MSRARLYLVQTTLGRRFSCSVVRWLRSQHPSRPISTSPVIAGTGSNSTREALALTKHAKAVGADGALLITPYYNKPTAAGLLAHYRTIAEGVDIPIMLYNVPSRTGINVAPETVAELHKIRNIVCIKEAAGNVDQVSQIRSLCGITVLSGDDSLTLPMMSVGAVGVVSVAANVAPAKVAALCARFAAGDLAAAQEIHYQLMPLFKGLFIETNPMPVKAVLARMGLIENVLRLPLTSAQPATVAKLEPIIKQLGII
ncbi:MAG: 4-hydroxy-tetrahydrodipicolinate synthase [Candidatus Hydrogenedentes bacterium]|nr:4-hydroxy-tetrahydrodipicolinate synthase [Candidatus Hydrogenedentota bacterium]